MNKIVGSIINHRYRVDRPLGEGAQGAVYEVFDLLASDKRALKLCSSGTPLSLEGEFFKLFEMQHPNLAQVYDFQLVTDIRAESGIASGAAFFTEELVKGVSADKFIQSLHQTAREQAVAHVGIGVARALGMLHSRGILHLDVKPSNIIVERDGKPRLIDLGLARSRERAVGVKVGTLGYMGKEVFDGLADDGTDIFALGQVLIQLLSGQAPSIHLNTHQETIIPTYVNKRFAAVLLGMTDENLKKRYSARETVLAIAKSGVIPFDDERHLDDASDADDMHSRFAVARSTRFVGREPQLAFIKQFFTDTFSTGETAVCVVYGPVGTGKTRLVRKSVAAMQVNQALSGATSVTFLSGTLRRVLEMILNVTSNEEFPILRNWLQHGANSSGRTESSRSESHVSESVMEQLFAALACLQGPVVALIEDASESLAGMARHVAQESSVARGKGAALIFEISSLDFSMSVLGDTPCIEVGPLSLTQEIEMVREITGETQDAAVMALFHQRTGGNPRFAEVLVEQLMKLEGQPKLEPHLFERELETTPEQVVAKKLFSNVGADDKALLSLMAVATAAVSVDELGSALQGKQRDEVERFAERMKAAGYIYVEQGKMALVPFVAQGISSLLDTEERVRLHGMLFAGLNPHRPPEHLGTHAFHAGNYTVAARFLRLAVDGAIRSGNMVRAITFLEMLYQCRIDDEASVLLELATCYRRSGKYTEALRLIAHLQSLSPSEYVLLEQAAATRLDGDWKTARKILQPLQSSDDTLIRYSACSLLARIHLDNGELLDGLALLQPLRIDSDFAHRSGMLNVMGLLHLTNGDVSEANRIFELGLATVKDTSPIDEARYYSYLGMVAHAQENWEAAARQYEAAYRLADEFGDAHGAATYVVNWAAALTELGDMKHALIRYRNGMNRLRIVGRPEELVQTEANYAQLLLRLGDISGALNVTAGALAENEAEGSPLVFGNALTVRGEALVAGGEYGNALRTLKRACHIFEERSQRAREHYCRLHMTAAYIHQGKIELAAAQLEKISDDAVISAIEYAAMRVQVAMQGKGNIRYEVDQLLLAFPDNALNFGLEHYKAMCVAVLALYHLSETTRWPMVLKVALDVLQRIRERTPAIHRPGSYPYETQMRELHIRSVEVAAESTENSREAQMKHQWLERLMRITARLNSELNVDTQLDIIMDTAVDVTGAERGFLLLREENGVFSIRSARNMDSEALLKQERNYSGTIARRAFEQGEPIVTTNAQEDEQFKEYRSVATLNLMYIVAVPLLVKGRAQGTIYLDSTTGGRFDSDRIELLKVLANQAAIALTNALLVSRVKTGREQIEKLNRQLSSKLALTEKELEQTRRDLREMNENLASKYNFYGLIGASKPMTDMFRVLERIAPTDIPVVIGGESGTGKELVAKAIHYAGTRKKKPFVAENCAAIPSQLLESILFGHVRGAFTGAVSNRSGLFVEAHEGTLFLDEIAEMPLEMQSKLLRVLQEGEVRPVGQNHSVRVDVRILVASNANLKDRVKEGRFREDLFYRLHVMEIKLPPLRDRSEDIAILASYFIKKHAPERKIHISRDALELLMNHRWPGNVRQLENEIVRATVMCGSVLDMEHLSEGIRDFSVSQFEETDDFSLDLHVNRLKKQLIRTALKKCRGNRSKASEMLGISRFGLQKMMSRLEMNDV